MNIKEIDLQQLGPNTFQVELIGDYNSTFFSIDSITMKEFVLKFRKLSEHFLFVNDKEEK